MTDIATLNKDLLKKHFQLMMQAKEAGYISDEERAMFCELARRGAEWKFDAETPLEFGWLIETGDHKYWNGKRANSDGFTHDPNEAVRFSRFEDSERVIHWLLQEYRVFLVSRQHSWMGGNAQAKLVAAVGDNPAIAAYFSDEDDPTP